MIQVRFLVGPPIKFYYFVKLNPYDIFKIHSESEFNDRAIKIFHFQYKNNFIYQTFVNYLFKNNHQKIYSINHYTDIPFLPIDFFKNHIVTCFPVNNHTLYFESSGTTKSNLSGHYIFNEEIYKQSILHGFQKFYGNPANYLFLFLLPNENERPHSSLIYMARLLQSFSDYKESGFYLNNLKKAIDIIHSANSNTNIFVFGLSYAIQDFAELQPQLNEHVIVMETGGMKGKREEMPKNILHTYLKKKLGVSNIHSEYGMTELLSQAYSKKNGLFYTPEWMKVLVRETDDPMVLHTQNKQGIINIIDLANIYSCAFIATSDVGKLHTDGSFELLGRSDFSDIRGCNLMYS